MTIKSKLILNIFVILLIITVMSFITLTVFRKADRIVMSLDGDIIPGMITMYEMNLEASKISSGILKYIIYDNNSSFEKKLIQAVGRLMQHSEKHLEHEKHIGEDEQHKAMVIKAYVDSISKEVKELIAMKKSGIKKELIFASKRDFDNLIMEQFLNNIDIHKNIHIVELKVGRKEIKNTLKANLKLTIAMIHIGIAIVIGFA